MSPRAVKKQVAPAPVPASPAMASISFQFVRSSAISSRLIEWFGGGYYSHVDCVLDDGTLLGARSDAVGGQDPGVRIRPKDYEKWERRTLLRLTVTQAQHDAWNAFLEKQLGKPYDKLGIVGLGLGRNWREDDAWFCSELATRSIEIAVLGRDLSLSPGKVDPGACSLVVSAIGGVVVEDVAAA